MHLQKRLKRWFRLRFAILYPLAVYIAFFSNSTDKSIRMGLWFIVPGLLLRLWANGYAVKTERLTTCGPYAFVRHPLYLGTALIFSGFMLMLRVYLVGILSLLVLSVIYYKTINKEEKMLQERFKDAYIDYKHKVPALIPTHYPYGKGEKWRFSLERLLKSKEHKVFLWMIIASVAFHLKDELILEHEKFDAKLIILICFLFALALLDLIVELVRNKLFQKTTSI